MSTLLEITLQKHFGVSALNALNSDVPYPKLKSGAKSLGITNARRKKDELLESIKSRVIALDRESVMQTCFGVSGLTDLSEDSISLDQLRTGAVKLGISVNGQTYDELRSDIAHALLEDKRPVEPKQSKQRKRKPTTTDPAQRKASKDDATIAGVSVIETFSISADNAIRKHLAFSDLARAVVEYKDLSVSKAKHLLKKADVESVISRKSLYGKIVADSTDEDGKSIRHTLSNKAVDSLFDEFVTVYQLSQVLLGGTKYSADSYRKKVRSAISRLATLDNYRMVTSAIRRHAFKDGTDTTAKVSEILGNAYELSEADFRDKYLKATPNADSPELKARKAICRAFGVKYGDWKESKALAEKIDEIGKLLGIIESESESESE